MPPVNSAIATPEPARVDTVPAGWYRDPLGLPQVRWWNGMGWTNRIDERRPEISANSRHDSGLVSTR
jgi:hypothetical protein